MNSIYFCHVTPKYISIDLFDFSFNRQLKHSERHSYYLFHVNMPAKKSANTLKTILNAQAITMPTLAPSAVF